MGSAADVISNAETPARIIGRKKEMRGSTGLCIACSSQWSKRSWTGEERVRLGTREKFTSGLLGRESGAESAGSPLAKYPAGFYNCKPAFARRFVAHSEVIWRMQFLMLGDLSPRLSSRVASVFTVRSTPRCP